MKNLSFLAIVFIYLNLACTSVVTENDQLSKSELDLNSFLNRIASPPSDKAIKESLYQYDNHLYDIHKFYDSFGNELLNVYTDFSGLDTVGIMTFEYSMDKLIKKTKYFLEENVDMTQHFDYLYDESQKLIQVKKDNSNFELYNYNSLNQVESIILGASLQLADVYEFTYDLKGKIDTQILKSLNGGETPLRYWVYFYDKEGKLLAKKVPEKPSNELKEMFTYFYDDQNRLIEINELYPEENFSLYGKTIYTYASILEGN
jgi:hypothetical protein